MKIVLGFEIEIKKLFFSKKVKDDFYLMEVKANGFELWLWPAIRVARGGKAIKIEQNATLHEREYLKK